MSQPLVAQETQGQSEDSPPKEIKTLDFSDFGFVNALEMAQAATRNQQQEFDTSKPVVGFGFQINDDKVTVVTVLPKSAAEGAGLEVGMVILRINGITMRGFTLVDIAKILGAIDGEITFDIEGRGRYSLIKAPIPPQGVED